MPLRQEPSRQSSSDSGKRADDGLHCVQEGAIQQHGKDPIEILPENAVLLQVWDMAAEHLVGAKNSPPRPERPQEIQALGGAEKFQR